MTPLSDRYLTVSQAAQHLKISRQRVLQLIKAQVLKAETIPIPGRSGFFYLLERKAVEKRVFSRRKERDPDRGHE